MGRIVNIVLTNQGLKPLESSLRYRSVDGLYLGRKILEGRVECGQLGV